MKLYLYRLINKLNPYQHGHSDVPTEINIVQIVSISATLISVILAARALILGSDLSNIDSILIGLPKIYYIGFAFLLAAFGLEIADAKRSKFLMWVQVALIESFMWLLPTMILGGLSFPAAGHDMVFYSGMASMKRFGHVDLPTYSYQSWPGSLLFASVLTIVIGTKLVTAFLTVPIIFNLLIAVYLYAILTKTHLGFDFHLALLGVVIFTLVNFTEQTTTLTFFSVGYLFYYFLILVVIRLFLSSSFFQLSPSVLVIFIVTATSLSITHPLIFVEAIGALISLLVIAVARRIPVTSRIFLTVFLTLAVLASWETFFVSQDFWGGNLHIILSNFPNILGALVGGTLASYHNTSVTHVFANYLKLGLFSAVSIMAIIGLSKSLRAGPASMKIYKTFLFIALGILFAGIAVSGLQGSNYNVYLYAAGMPFIIIFSIKGISYMSRRAYLSLLVLGLVVASPAALITSYSNISVEQVSQQNIVAAKFYSNFAPAASLASPHLMMTPVGTATAIGYYGSNLGSLYPFTVVYEPVSYLRNLIPEFVVIGTEQLLASEYYYGNFSVSSNLSEELNNNYTYGLIYSSKFVNLYGFT